MIRQQAMNDHQTTTGHAGFRGTVDETGRVVCTECPWEYPIVDPEPTLLPREPEVEHVHDTACADGTLYCPTRDYEANPIDPPTDPEPAMGPVDDQVDENTDPGPEPEEPTPEPPLTLRDRIANLIDVYFGMQDGNPGLPNAAAAADLTDAIHKVVAAGGDFTEREEGVELTPAQGIAYLLDLPEWARISRLGMLMEQARDGSNCRMYQHDDLAAELRDVRASRNRLHHAMVQIARLTSTIDQPESVGQSVIGSISSEALVPE